MSRLNSMIRRLSAQRDILNHLAHYHDLPRTGAILELGLGNGRTFSHLSELFPDRRIIAFDRALAAHGSSIPATDNLVLGEISETTLQYKGRGAALVHVDIATGYPERDVEIATDLSTLIPALLTVGGYCASGVPLTNSILAPLPLPTGIEPDRYFVYQRI